MRINKKRFAIFLIMLFAVLSCVLVSVTGARYYSDINGTLRANVAIINARVVSSDGSSSAEIILKSGVYTVDYSFDVVNYSGSRVCDVNLEYSLKVTLPEELHEKVSMVMIRRATSEQIQESSRSGNELTYSDLGTFTAKVKKSDGYVLRFTMAEDMEETYKLEDIKIEATLTQIR